eukprot:6819638-Lingulodinium_polyedra.AAC.1
MFRQPWRAALPAAASWRSLEPQAGEPLHLAQLGVNTAFYRIKAPPGMQELFKLPAVSCAALRRC